MSINKDEEYKELFLAEALENLEALNELFTGLEKNPSDVNAVNELFRIAHTLKGNAMGLGFDEVADLSHVMEDVLAEIKSGRISLTQDLFDALFKANDKLAALIEAIKSGAKVAYKGVRTKLSVYLKRNLPKDEADEVSENLPGLAEETQNVSDQEEALENRLEENVTHETQAKNTLVSSDWVQVPVSKLDALLNLVGELIVERDRLMAVNLSAGGSANLYSRLQRVTSDLQFGVMDARLVQIGFVFHKFHRIVRDVAAAEGKSVVLELKGTEIEIDRNILKTVSDSLIHLVRNAVGHGIESKEKRKAAGKPETGTVYMTASNDKDFVVIEITDDGRGMDHEAIGRKALERGLISPDFLRSASREDLLMLIFLPEFSTAETVTDISGRGVGMDAVKETVESVGGNVKLATEIGKGTCITLSLPASMALKPVLLFQVREQVFAAPLTYMEAVLAMPKSDIFVAGGAPVAVYLGQAIPLVFLGDYFYEKENYNGKTVLEALPADARQEMLVVSYGSILVGVAVDKLLQQKEIIEKPLSKPLDGSSLVNGTAILGSGEVCLVLDVPGIVNSMLKQKRKSTL